MKSYLLALTSMCLLTGSLYLIGKGNYHYTSTKNKTVDSDITLVQSHQLSVPVTSVELEGSTKAIKQLKLTSSNTIVLFGEIGPETTSIGQQITELAQSGKPIYLLINSPGGSVMDGNLIVSAIQASTVPVYTICLQMCASMAAIIHQFGTERYMVDRSILMFHEASGGVSGQFNQMKSRFYTFDRLISKLDTEIAKRVGLEPAAFMAKLPNELWIDAEDAIKQNFADKLVNLNLASYNNSNEVSNILSQTNDLKKKIDVKLLH